MGFLLFILLQGLAGVIDGIRYYRYIREYLRAPVKAWTPFASVVLPAKVSTMNWNKMLKRCCAKSIPITK